MTLLHDSTAPVAHLVWGTPLAVLDGGSHRPLQCELEEPGGIAARWIVKSRSMYVHGSTNLLREFVGSDFAALLGLTTPAVALLDLPALPPPTDESPTGARAAEVLRADAGTQAFCARWVEAPVLQQAVLGQSRSTSFVRDAIFVFCFDALLWHYDRTAGNPNVLHYGDRIVVIDHDRVCHGVERIDESGSAPDYGAVALQRDGEDRSALLQEHIFAGFLRPFGGHPAWDEFVVQAEALGDEDVQRTLARWPDTLDQAKNGAPAGLKHDLRRFLRVRIQEARRIVEEARRVVT